MHTISGKRVTNAAANNYLAAKNLLQLARSQEDGSFYWSMATVVFTAFTYEAFLNVVGEEVLGSEEWKKIDRASWRKKHAAVLTALSLPSDLSSRPESTLIELFEFRNQMAHGREEELVLNGISVADLRPLTLQEATSTEWEKKCTTVYAATAFEDVRAMGFKISKAANRPVCGDNPFGIPSHGHYSGNCA